MKRFGFHPDQIYFKMRNPMKVRYLNTKNLGNFEAPAKTSEKNLHKLHANYQKRLDFEKYLCPKGVKPTITSRFKKPRESQEFVSHEMTLARTPTTLASNEVRFRCDPFLTKHEIQEYLGKLYRMPFKNNEMPNTSNQMGKVMQNRENRTQWRKKDYKKVTVRLEYEVDPDF